MTPDTETDAVAGLVEDHERIWLQPKADSYGDDGRQWCQDKVWPLDDGLEPTEYVRADLAVTALATFQQENETIRRERDNAREYASLNDHLLKAAEARALTAESERDAWRHAFAADGRDERYFQKAMAAQARAAAAEAALAGAYERMRESAAVAAEGPEFWPHPRQPGDILTYRGTKEGNWLAVKPPYQLDLYSQGRADAAAAIRSLPIPETVTRGFPTPKAFIDFFVSDPSRALQEILSRDPSQTTALPIPETEARPDAVSVIEALALKEQDNAS